MKVGGVVEVCTDEELLCGQIVMYTFGIAC